MRVVIPKDCKTLEECLLPAVPQIGMSPALGTPFSSNQGHHGACQEAHLGHSNLHDDHRNLVDACQQLVANATSSIGAMHLDGARRYPSDKLDKPKWRSTKQQLASNDFVVRSC